MARTIVVTGSASGIGKATAALLASRGERVIGVDLRDADVCADLSTPDGCAAMARQVETLAAGRLDSIVANAGVTDSRVYAVNYFGAIATLEALRPMLAGSHAPRAALTASVAATFPCDMRAVEALERGERSPDFPGQNDYAVSKVAIARWVRRASPDWARGGVLLNAVGPGVVDTPLIGQASQNHTEADAGTAALVQATPLGRMARAEELAAVLGFLVSPANSFIAGQVIYADGGLEAAIRPDQV